MPDASRPINMVVRTGADKRANQPGLRPKAMRRVDAGCQSDENDSMSTKDRIIAKLTEALAPQALEVIDESDKHAGHGGWREGGETHFRVRIVSPVFSGMSRVNRHRKVNELLAEDLAAGVHALAIEARAPDEADPRAARATAS